MENKENVYGPTNDNYGRDKKPWDKPPTAVDELDLDERARKYLMETIHDDNHAIFNAFIAGWNDHAQTKQSKVVEVIEGMRYSQEFNDEARIYNQALTDLLTKFKES